MKRRDFAKFLMGATGAVVLGATMGCAEKKDDKKDGDKKDGEKKDGEKK